jgi:hypothetical protein
LETFRIAVIIEGMPILFTLLLLPVTTFALTPLTEVQFKSKEAARFCSPLSRDEKVWRGHAGPNRIPAADRSRALAYLSACDVLTFDYTPKDEKSLVEALQASAREALGSAEVAFSGCWRQCFAIGELLNDSKSQLSKDEQSDLKRFSVAILKKPKFSSFHTAAFQQKFLESAAKSKLLIVAPEKLATGAALSQKLKAQTEKVYAKEDALLEEAGKEIDEKTSDKVFEMRAENFRAIRSMMTPVNELAAEIAAKNAR